jgi:signal peptidase I
MRGILKFLFGTIIVVAFVAIVGRIFFFELAETRSYSMVPTLVAGDVFILWTRGLIGQGDIALCANPEDPSEMIALRVVGLPGDRIAFQRNHLVINNRMIQHDIVDPLIYVDNTSGEKIEYAVKISEEYIGGSLFHVALMDRAGGGEARVLVVPKDHFFMVGDNRNLARDSRNFGSVPIESCIGRAVFLLWPGEDSGGLRRGQRLFSAL